MTGLSRPTFDVYPREIVNRNGSVTFYLRSIDPISGQEYQAKVARTEPNPTDRSMRKWRRQVRELAFHAKCVAMGGEGRAPGVQWLPLRMGLLRYLDWLQTADEYGRPNGAATTIQAKERVIGGFITFVESHRIFPRTKDAMHKVLLYHVSRWRDESLIPQRLSATTINTHLAFVSAFFQWGVDHGYCLTNPLHGLMRRKVKASERIVPIQTPEQLRELLAQIEKPFRKASVLLLACTGIRQGELKTLTWADWDKVGGMLSIKPSVTERTKKHERILPLCPQATLALEKLHSMSNSELICPQEGNHKKAMSVQINHWLKPLGVKPHDLRRFYRSALESLGVPNGIIDDLLGHCTNKVRAAYTPSMSAGARSWVDKFGEWLG